jgi:hypothetical protein
LSNLTFFLVGCQATNFSGHFCKREYLRLRRAIIIFILRKEDKADYLFLGSYYPITLENTLSKILERVIADRIVDTVEEYALLLQSQIGARKNRLTLLALTLLTTTISTYATYYHY